MSTGVWWEEHQEVLGARTFSAINQLYDLGKLMLPLYDLIPSPVWQVQAHARGLALPKGLLCRV